MEAMPLTELGIVGALLLALGVVGKWMMDTNTKQNDARFMEAEKSRGDFKTALDTVVTAFEKEMAEFRTTWQRERDADRNLLAQQQTTIINLLTGHLSHVLPGTTLQTTTTVKENKS